MVHQAGRAVSGPAVGLYLQVEIIFIVRNREAFFQTLDALKKSDVVIDSETLELIRTFS